MSLPFATVQSALLLFADFNDPYALIQPQFATPINIQLDLIGKVAQALTVNLTSPNYNVVFSPASVQFQPSWPNAVQSYDVSMTVVGYLGGPTSDSVRISARLSSTDAALDGGVIADVAPVTPDGRAPPATLITQTFTAGALW